MLKLSPHKLRGTDFHRSLSPGSLERRSEDLQRHRQHAAEGPKRRSSYRRLLTPDHIPPLLFHCPLLFLRMVSHPRVAPHPRAHTHIHESKSPPHTSMCSRAGPRAGCGALEVARDVTASQARRTDVNIDIDIYMYLYLKGGKSNIEMHRGIRATFNGRFDFACVGFFYAPSLC